MFQLLFLLLNLTRLLSTAPPSAGDPPAPSGDPPSGDPPPAPDPAPAPSATPPTPASTDHMIPKARFDEINSRMQQAEQAAAELRQQILDREAAEAAEREKVAAAAAQAEAERLEAEKKAEEEEAERQRQWQKLADKREREIGDKVRRITELEAQNTQLTSQVNTTREQMQGELATAQATSQRYATLLNELIETETATWPDEVKALDPGATALEQRLQWAKQARPLAQRLLNPTKPGNPRPPQPQSRTPSTTSGEPSDKERERLQSTGMYGL